MSCKVEVYEASTETVAEVLQPLDAEDGLIRHVDFAKKP